MHLKKVKGILSSSNGMNLYRGCTHGCIYCDSRSKCYHMEHAFEDVEVKENAIVLLEKTLRRKRLKCMLSTGSMTDPYIPLEDEFGNVRKALSLAYKYGFGFTLITKSNRVLKDLDLLKAINDKTKCVVQMTLTTYDEDLCKKIEPNVSTTKERVETLKKLHDKGIYTILCISPIFPYITDYEEIIEKAKGFVDEYWFENLNLRQPYKTTILNFIQSNYPEYYEKYKEIYIDKNREYWFFMKHNIIQYCKKHKLTYKIDFRHS